MPAAEGAALAVTGNITQAEGAPLSVSGSSAALPGAAPDDQTESTGRSHRRLREQCLTVPHVNILLYADHSLD